LPTRSRAVLPQTRQFFPVLAAVRRSKDGGIFHSRVDRLRIGERWFQMPDAFELPRMRSAVVPLMSAGDAGIGKRLADRLPRLSAVIGPLHELTKPTRRLRCVEPVRLDRRTLEMINLPAAEMRAANVPPLAFAVCRQDERPFASADQNTNSAHPFS